MRAPIKWLHGVKSPTFVFEGAGGDSNIGAVRLLSRTSRNQQIRFFPIAGGDHFSIIQPLSEVIAAQILADTGTMPQFDFSELRLFPSAQ